MLNVCVRERLQHFRCHSLLLLSLGRVLRRVRSRERSWREAETRTENRNLGFDFKGFEENARNDRKENVLCVFVFFFSVYALVYLFKKNRSRLFAFLFFPLLIYRTSFRGIMFKKFVT